MAWFSVKYYEKFEKYIKCDNSWNKKIEIFIYT